MREATSSKSAGGCSARQTKTSPPDAAQVHGGEAEAVRGRSRRAGRVRAAVCRPDRRSTCGIRRPGSRPSRSLPGRGGRPGAGTRCGRRAVPPRRRGRAAPSTARSRSRPRCGLPARAARRRRPHRSTGGRRRRRCRGRRTPGRCRTGPPGCAREPVVPPRRGSGRFAWRGCFPVRSRFSLRRAPRRAPAHGRRRRRTGGACGPVSAAEAAAPDHIGRQRRRPSRTAEWMLRLVTASPMRKSW